jgi:hypothetical protein
LGLSSGAAANRSAKKADGSPLFWISPLNRESLVTPDNSIELILLGEL